MPAKRTLFFTSFLALISGCAEFDRAPDLDKEAGRAFPTEREAMIRGSFNNFSAPQDTSGSASLWAGRNSLFFGDRRARNIGDIVTVSIQIDDKAEFANSTGASRSSSSNLSVPQLFGVPQRVDKQLPDGASLANGVELDSTRSFSGDGSTRRNEKLDLSVAATVTDVLPNGVMRIDGTQDVRVNYETRELKLSGYIRRKDISIDNRIDYEKIASAKISYGGTGEIARSQRDRYGNRLLDFLLPF